MAELSLRNLVKIYPFSTPRGIFDRKRAERALEREHQQPYTTNEGVIVLQRFSLEIEHGEFLVLLGPSGCGKTTLLRLIAGLEDVSDGEIWLDGVMINGLRPEQRDLAMVFQNYSLYPHLTVYDNIAFTLRNRRVPRDELDERVRWVAEVMQISRHLYQRPKELSGGEQQRVAIGRAIIRRPKLFLLDEPFSNLDSALRAQMREVVRQLHQRLGTTFIYVTHDQLEATSLGSRIVVMRDGMIQQVGTPRELYNRPANLSVASFVGSPRINIFSRTKLVREHGQWRASLLGELVPLPAQKSCDLSDEWEGREVKAAVRPAHIRLGSEGFIARVVAVEPLGAETNLHLLAGETEVVAVSSNTGGNIPYFPGQTVCFTFEPGRMLLFDPENETRIM